MQKISGNVWNCNEIYKKGNAKYDTICKIGLKEDNECLAYVDLRTVAWRSLKY